MSLFGLGNHYSGLQNVARDPWDEMRRYNGMQQAYAEHYNRSMSQSLAIARGESQNDDEQNETPNKLLLLEDI